MGGQLSNLIEEALSKWFTVDSGRLNVLKASYIADNVKLTPLAVAEGLWVTGTIASLQVSTTHVGILLSVLGNSPPVRLNASEVDLHLVTECPEGVQMASMSDIAPSDSLGRHLKKLLIDVTSVNVTLHLGGQLLRLQASSLQMKPQEGSSQMLCSWQLEHRAVKLLLDHVDVGSAENDSACVCLFGSPHYRVELGFKTELRVHLEDTQVLALLNVVEAVEVLAAIARNTSAVRAAVVCQQVALTAGKASFRLGAYGEQLLIASISAATASVTPTECRIELVRATVASGSGPEVVSDSVSVRAALPDGRPIVEHRFTLPASDAQKSFPPWRGTVELLAADPRFVQHRSRIAVLCDGFDAIPATYTLVTGRKRQRGEDVGEDDVAEQLQSASQRARKQ